MKYAVKHNTIYILRWQLFVYVLMCICVIMLSSCGDKKVRFFGVDTWAYDVDFSADGKELFVISGHRIDLPGYNGVKRDTIEVYEVGTWKRILKYRSNGRIGQVYGCANPDIVIYAEDSFPDNERVDLVFRSLHPGQRGRNPPWTSLPHSG